MTRNPLSFLMSLLVLAGCASAPPANQALEEARAAYREAQADPHVPGLAPEELDAAGRSLNRAESLWRQNAPPLFVAHEAYLAGQRSRIARETAMMRAAEQEFQQASGARERAILEARARRQGDAADEAHRRAAEQQQQAQALRAEVGRLEARVAELDARPSERGWVLGLGGDVLFDVGQSTLKPGARRTLEQLAAFLERHPERAVIIEGFTDSTGSAELNRRLSEQRAQAVRDALVRMGIERQRLTVRGMGDAFPVASNDTAAGRQLNRRVEIVLAEGSEAATGGSR